MAEIPLFRRSHGKAKKLTDEEQEKRNKLLESSIVTKGWVKKGKKENCFYRKVSSDLQKKFQQTVYPVCPWLRKLMTKEESNRLAVIAHGFNERRKSCYKTPDLLVWDSIMQILLVFESLIKLKPDQTIVNCAHTENFLKGRLDLIRSDLSALPQSLEKDHPQTSIECRELIEELKIAELAYDVQSHAYLAPHNFKNGNWVTFLAWRDQQINPTHCSRIEILNLTSYYPAEAIKVMYTLHKKLSPLAVKILPEQALVKNQRKADFEKMFEEFSAKLTQTEQEKELDKPTRHSVDFRSVHWLGTDYNFTPPQAAAVELLWKAWENKTPDIGGDTLAEKIGSEAKRPRDIFKGHPALGSMIKKGNTKGSYRLIEPK